MTCEKLGYEGLRVLLQKNHTWKSSSPFFFHLAVLPRGLQPTHSHSQALPTWKERNQQMMWGSTPHYRFLPPFSFLQQMFICRRVFAWKMIYVIPLMVLLLSAKQGMSRPTYTNILLINNNDKFMIIYSRNLVL